MCSYSSFSNHLALHNEREWKKWGDRGIGRENMGLWYYVFVIAQKEVMALNQTINHFTLRWRHMRVMASPVTGNSTVCLTAIKVPHHWPFERTIHRWQLDKGSEMRKTFSRHDVVMNGEFLDIYLMEFMSGFACWWFAFLSKLWKFIPQLWSPQTK